MNRAGASERTRAGEGEGGRGQYAPVVSARAYVIQFLILTARSSGRRSQMLAGM